MFLVVILFCLPVLLLSDMVSTHGNGSSTTSLVSMPSLDVQATVHEDGTIDVLETFEMTFLQKGLTEVVRFVPYVSYEYRDIDGKVEKNVRYAKIKDATGTGGAFTIYVDEITGYLTFGIKSSTFFAKDETRAFKISYTFDLGKDLNKRFDDVYFNLVGTNSTCDINNVTYSVTFDDISKANDIKIYSGKSGSTDTLSFSVDGNTISGSVSKLLSGEGITLRAIFDDGYLKTAKVKINGYQIASIVLCFLGILIAVFCFVKFRQKKDYPRPVELVPFDGLDPFVADYMENEKISTKTISASVICLANLGYLKIEQKEKDQIILHKTEKSIADEKNVGLRGVYNALFLNGKNAVQISELGIVFAQSVTALRSAEKEKQKAKLYDSKRTKTYGLLNLAYVVLLILAVVFSTLSQREFFGFTTGIFAFVNFLTGVFALYSVFLMVFKSKNLWIYNLISSGLFVVFMSIAYSRHNLSTIDPYCICLVSLLILSVLPCFINVTLKYSASGIVTKGRVEGFKNYIKTCEVEQLKMFAKENPTYYFDVLPYAYVFGLSDVWMEKFKGIEVSVPEWIYSDSGVFFDFFMFNSMFGNFNSRFEKTFNLSNVLSGVSGTFRSSGGGGSRGFGGGGFSGGGSGGGGFGAR